MLRSMLIFFFFFNDTATTEIYTLSLHDALPISILSSASQTGRAIWYERSSGRPPATESGCRCCAITIGCSSSAGMSESKRLTAWRPPQDAPMQIRSYTCASSGDVAELLGREHQAMEGR